MSTVGGIVRTTDQIRSILVRISNESTDSLATAVRCIAVGAAQLYRRLGTWPRLSYAGYTRYKKIGTSYWEAFVLSLLYHKFVKKHTAAAMRFLYVFFCFCFSFLCFFIIFVYLGTIYIISANTQCAVNLSPTFEMVAPPLCRSTKRNWQRSDEIRFENLYASGYRCADAGFQCSLISVWCPQLLKQLHLVTIRSSSRLNRLL